MKSSKIWILCCGVILFGWAGFGFGMDEIDISQKNIRKMKKTRLAQKKEARIKFEALSKIFCSCQPQIPGRKRAKSFGGTKTQKKHLPENKENEENEALFPFDEDLYDDCEWKNKEVSPKSSLNSLYNISVISSNYTYPLQNLLECTV